MGGSLEGLRTVFETNEFMDLPVNVIYYGKLQHKTRGQAKWVGTPETVLTFIQKYCEDNGSDVIIAHLSLSIC